MSNSDKGLLSPPYPSHLTNSYRLYRCLIQLREWVVDQQNELRPYVDALSIEEQKHGRYKAAEAIRKTHEQMDEPDNIPAETIWETVSVWDKYGCLMYLRQIRETWDYMLREHEDAWDSKLAVHKRCNLLQMARHILDEAFISPEVREMHNQKAQDEAMRQMQAYRRAIKKLMVPKEMQNDDDETTTTDTEHNETEETGWFDKEEDEER